MLAKFDVKSTGKVDFEEYCICMGPGHYSHDQHLSRGEIKVHIRQSRPDIRQSRPELRQSWHIKTVKAILWPWLEPFSRRKS